MQLYEANIPEYSHTMHLQGYSATDVYRAFKESQRKKHSQKREQSILEKELYAFMYNSLQACLNEALDDIEKSWK